MNLNFFFPSFFSDLPYAKYVVDRAFINTCLRLDNAVRILKAFAKQRVSTNTIPADDMPRDVSKMATKVFQGLRAVYAVSHPCNHGISVLLVQVGFIYNFNLHQKG